MCTLSIPFVDSRTRATIASTKGVAAVQSKASTRPKASRKAGFNAQDFLDSTGIARKVTEFKKKETIFSQGDLAKNVLYIQKGGVTLSVVNETGKEAVV